MKKPGKKAEKDSSRLTDAAEAKLACFPARHYLFRVPPPLRFGFYPVMRRLTHYAQRLRSNQELK